MPKSKKETLIDIETKLLNLQLSAAEVSDEAKEPDLSALALDIFTSVKASADE